MFQLKLLTKAAVPSAMAKAERYRLLNEPAEAESICLDILAVDPHHHDALVGLLLSLTDQFGKDRPDSVERANVALARVTDPYEQAYYAGIIAERRARARLEIGGPGSGSMAYELLRDAMHSYETAEQIRPTGNDDALLRWNTCARLIMSNSKLKPMPEDKSEPYLE